MQSEMYPSELIVQIVSGGPKNYTYMLITNEWKKSFCKVRVMPLNYHTSKLVNFEVIKAMILKQGESVVNVHTELQIKRKRASGTTHVVTEP